MLDGYIRGLDLVCSRVKANNLLRSSFTTVSCHQPLANNNNDAGGCSREWGKRILGCSSSPSCAHASAPYTRQITHSAKSTHLRQGTLAQLGQNELRESLFLLPEVLDDLLDDPRSHLGLDDVVGFYHLPVDLVREKLLAILRPGQAEEHVVEGTTLTTNCPHGAGKLMANAKQVHHSICLRRNNLILRLRYSNFLLSS